MGTGITDVLLFNSFRVASDCPLAVETSAQLMSLSVVSEEDGSE